MIKNKTVHFPFKFQNHAAFSSVSAVTSVESMKIVSKLCRHIPELSIFPLFED